MRTSKRHHKQPNKKKLLKHKKTSAVSVEHQDSIVDLNQLAHRHVQEQQSEQIFPKIPLAQHIKHVKIIFIILLCYAVSAVWIMQNSINAYYLQTYHQSSPLNALNQFTAWRWGGYVGDALNTARDYINGHISAVNQRSVEQHNQALNLNIPSDIQNDLTHQDGKTHHADSSSQQPSTAMTADDTGQIPSPQVFTLTAHDEIFFAGDSMMQGVAPHIQKSLQQYKIKSVNLSKQSTGLSYPKFFNWPQTIKDTLENNPKIKVLVVFLGANDPWDIQNPKNGRAIKFKSAEWEQVYRSRIAEILNIAKQHQVQVIWLSPPNMKKNQLNQQMVYMNQVMQDELQLHEALYIDTRPLLGGKDNVYNDYLVKNGKPIKMRSSDGIHFSIQGQKELAQIIQQQLTILPEQ